MIRLPLSIDALRRTVRLATCFAFAATISATTASAGDWLQFRGNQTTGEAVGEKAPTDLKEAKIAWKIDLEGRGLSGPIVIGDRVVLTSSSGANQERLRVLCFSVADGSLRWERQFQATGRTQCHGKMSVATPTAASDGKRIFAFFSSNDLACLDLDGNLLWFRGLTHDYPNASNSLGMASSPVVVGDTLVVQVECDAESFSTGLDVENGLPRWKIDRPRFANWCSPAVVGTGKDALAVLQSSKGLSVVEPRTGRVVWEFDGGADTIPSSVAFGELLIAPSKGLTAVKPGKENAAEVVWQTSKMTPATSSPVVLDGRVFTANRAGALTCGDAKTGDVLWQARLKGPFSATPIAAAGHLYFVNEEGLVQVVRVDEKAGEIVSDLALGETILGTPAIARGALYLRSDKHLWKIAE